MALNWLGYQEFLDTFTYREKAAITIPKGVREKAFSLQIDVEIVSTLGQEYQNFRSTPPHGFYGYVVVVLRNYAKLQIPIQQAKQTIYYERVEEAYVNWYSLFVQRVAREKSLIDLQLIVAIALAVGIESAALVPQACPYWCGFEEVPIREIYIETKFGTQFDVTIGWFEPVILPDETGCLYDGKSGQIDDVELDGTGRDQGLPPLGNLPQNSQDVEDPYKNLPPPSTAAQLGEYGNSKADNLDDIDPNNAPVEPPPDPVGTIYWVTIIGRVKRPFFPNGCAATRVEKNSYIVLKTTNSALFTPLGASASNGCNGNFPSGGWNVTLTGGQPFQTGNSDSEPQAQFGQGLTLPVAALYFE